MHKSQNVIIIGAGISGLSAGFFCLKKGHHVTILEKCATPGGVSTNWKRKGFTFEGGIHWLAGTTPRMQPFHRLWKETGALADNNPIVFEDPVFTYTDGNVKLHLWRDAKKTRNEFLAFAPEDSCAIRRLYRHIRFIGNVTGSITKWQHVLYLVIYLPHFICFVTILFFTSTEKYLSHFHNTQLRQMLSAVINPQQNAISLIFTLSGYNLGDNGFPEGGSRRLAQNMADKITSMGGDIHYNKNVQQIVIRDKKVQGVQTSEGFIPADHVIVAMDTRAALEKLFEEPLQERWAKKLLKQDLESEQCMFISFGIKANLSHLPKTLRVHLPEPLNMGSLSYNTLWVNNYAGQNGYSPAGCTSLSLLFLGDSYDYWFKAREDGTYHDKKRQCILDVITELQKHIPEIHGNVLVSDMATPITYERYCNSHHGGYMGIWRAGTLPPTFPSSSSSIQGLHFAGMRLRLSGGLPIALMTGYKAAKRI